MKNSSSAAAAAAAAGRNRSSFDDVRNIIFYSGFACVLWPQNLSYFIILCKNFIEAKKRTRDFKYTPVRFTFYLQWILDECL